jgi:hypothetical protein
MGFLRVSLECSCHTFRSETADRTQVTEHGYTSDQAHDISKAGLEQCLDKMAAIFVEAR